jgi:hypothetical protein
MLFMRGTEGVERGTSKIKFQRYAGQHAVAYKTKVQHARDTP